jgi:hypothetical protein
LLFHKLLDLSPVLVCMAVHYFPCPRYIFLLCRGREVLPWPCRVFLGLPDLNSVRASPVRDLTAIS